MSDGFIKRATKGVKTLKGTKTYNAVGRYCRDHRALENQSWAKKVAKGRKATKAARRARKLNRAK